MRALRIDPSPEIATDFAKGLQAYWSSKKVLCKRQQSLIMINSSQKARAEQALEALGFTFGPIGAQHYWHKDHTWCLQLGYGTARLMIHSLVDNPLLKSPLAQDHHVYGTFFGTDHDQAVIAISDLGFVLSHSMRLASGKMADVFKAEEFTVTLHPTGYAQIRGMAVPQSTLGNPYSRGA